MRSASADAMFTDLLSCRCQINVYVLIYSATRPLPGAYVGVHEKHYIIRHFLTTSLAVIRNASTVTRSPH